MAVREQDGLYHLLRGKIKIKLKKLDQEADKRPTVKEHVEISVK